MRRPKLLPTLTAVVVVATAVSACSPKAPSHDRAVEILGDVCAERAAVTAQLGLPTDVFALSEVADQAFAGASDGIAHMQTKGLAAMDDDAPIQRYLKGAIHMNNALAALSRAAAFEDVAAIEAAIGTAGGAGDDLDGAAAELGLDPACGRVAWAGALLEHAATVATLERELMTPTGDLVADVATFCTRWDRSLGRAATPGTPDGDRGYAFTVTYAARLLAARLRTLQPGTAEHGAWRDDLVQQLDELLAVLDPAETLAIDERDDELRAVVTDAADRVAAIDAALAAMGVEC